jgi:hypothetical protein
VSKHDAAQYVDVTHSDEGGGMKLRSVFTSRWLLLLGRLLVPSAPAPDLLSIPLGIPYLRVNAVKETNSLLGLHFTKELTLQVYENKVFGENIWN